MEKSLRNRGYTLIRHLQQDGDYGVCVVTASNEFISRQPIKYICKYGNSTGRLAREVNYMKQITHSLFPRWHEDWQEEGRTYLIMEYISGTTIEELLKRRGSIFLWDALSITVDLAAGLLHLHENRPPILYRDLKPSNVMIQDTGTVRLIDLGTADERPTVMAGTPGYTAPEILDDPVSLHTPTCDVYSVGILLHTMLTGHDPTRPPYRLEPLAAYGLRRLESIDQIILDCTCTDPQDRIPGMRELLHRINDFRPGFRFSISRTKDTLQYQKNIWLTTYQKV